MPLLWLLHVLMNKERRTVFLGDKLLRELARTPNNKVPQISASQALSEAEDRIAKDLETMKKLLPRIG
jgi:hypothetical protein